MQAIFRTYTRYVIDEAWPLQQQGLIPRGGTDITSQFQERLLQFEPATKGQEILHAQTLAQFNSFVETRRIRLNAVSSGIPAILWYVVAIGAAVNIVLVWLLDVKFIAHLFLGGIASLFLATLIALVAAMDCPFRGEVSIAPDAFESVYQQLLNPDANAANP